MSSGKPQSPLEHQLARLRSVESINDLSDRQRTVIKFTLALTGVILLYSVIYHIGMVRLEEESQSFAQSLQVVINTLTTTGYGEDAPWRSELMNLLVMVYQISGVIIGFITLRILVIPLFERAPVVLDSRLTAKDDHAVVCEYERGEEVLLDELEESDYGYVLVESDKDRAVSLSNRDYQVIDGDPSETETLERASTGGASLVVTDARDRNASVTLTARQLNDEARVVCLTESPERMEALERIGADRIVCLPALLGRRLAEKASVTFGETEPSDVIGEGTVVREVVVEGIEVVDVETAEEMNDAVQSRRDTADFVFMAAAVADYTPAETSPTKRKKDEHDLVLHLRRTPDILKTLGESKRPEQVLVGFALETNDGLQNARRKLEDKNLDWIVLNNPTEEGAGFGPSTNRVTLLSRTGDTEDLPLMSKSDVADALLDRVLAQHSNTDS